ncbi:beta galactosidase jelly roll domain-containing protein [Elusimicrobiota bacterium]
MDFRAWIITLAVVSVLNMFNIGKDQPEREIIIRGNWLFRTGYETFWVDPGFDEKGWSSIRVPGIWEDQGYMDYNGSACYRKHIRIPADWDDINGLTFHVGKIDDEDRVYFNGHLIGASTGWKKPRIYSIPVRLIRFGSDNVIAVVVNDTGGKGGIWDGPVSITTGLAQRFNVQEY